MVGFHHHIYPVGLTNVLADRNGLPRGSKVALRLRRPSEDVLDVTMRTWSQEGAILAAVRPWLPNIPSRVTGNSVYSVHTYAPGMVLAEVSPPGEKVDPAHLEQMGPIFAGLLRVPVDSLPEVPQDWPRRNSSSGFLSVLLRFTERMRRAYDKEFGLLFERLGVPSDGMALVASSLPTLSDRPSALLHTDLHRRNLVVRDDRRLHVIDWELATLGDPLYELATHLCRMGYPESQWDDAAMVWYRAAESVSPSYVQRFEDDLEVYLRYERAQSVYPDVMRAARDMVRPLSPTGPDQAARLVLVALERAAGSLGWKRLPSQAAIERALDEWLRSPGLKPLQPAAARL